jgi:hypothetical protein
MKLSRFTSRIVVVGAAAAVLSGSAVALATGGGGSDVYKACVKSQGKTLYNVLVLVNPRSGPNCRPGDKVITWNEQGPRGPRGPEGPPGEPGTGTPLILTTQSSTVGGTNTIGVTATALCPPDSVPTGGGFAVSGETVGFSVRRSEPFFPGSSTTPTGWQAEVRLDAQGNATLTAWVTCLGDETPV